MDEVKEQMRKDIEDEIKMKTKSQLLNEIQMQEQRKKAEANAIYKKGDLFYAIIIIIALIIVLSVIFSWH